MGKKAKDLSPKSGAKKVKGGVQVSDMVNSAAGDALNELGPNDRRNLKKATKDLTMGVVKPK